jgi:hypothetical protein
MRFAILGGLLAVGFRMIAIAEGPKVAKAADLERVLKACESIRVLYHPAELQTGVPAALEAYRETGAPRGIPAIVDMRVYELFCK